MTYLTPQLRLQSIHKDTSKRMQTSLNDIIGTEQTATIRGRTIIENLQLCRDIISYVNINKTAYQP